jgi:uncharacterized protein with NRDE domain
MCLVFFAHDCHPRYRLLLIANRDEFYRRPTRPAQFWPEQPELLAGRDEVAGGTWLGVTRAGRWGLVTNIRNRADLELHGSPSRGRLVTAALKDECSPRTHINTLAAASATAAVRGFNLLLGDATEVVWYANRGGDPMTLSPGCYGLSNALLDTPWPKLVTGKAEFSDLLAADEPDEAALFSLLADKHLAPADLLPDTGFGNEWEQMLSARFVQSADYGTRIATLLRIDRAGHIDFVERSFDRAPERWREVRHSFQAVRVGDE